ncbi:MAG TPA: heparinase II/III family protein [Candidatus Binatia bacterium]|nr:heparinase II/III family protein [Candidatus Binatia bacterium]
MGDELNVRDSGTDDATGGSGLQGRLRSALLTRGWNRGPEPRVRSGVTLLPGLACLGPADRSAGAELLAGAEALRAGRLSLLGRVTPCRGEIDWAGREATPSWRVALHGLEHLTPAAFAAVLAESPEERAAWWTLVATHLQDWLTRGRRGHGAAARLEAQTRRVTNLLQLATIFADELQADPDLRRALLEAVHTDAMSLSVTLPRHPADVWLVVGARALHAAGRFFDGDEPRSWVDSAITILWRQLRELVHDDGGLRDRSPARQALVLAEYLELFASLWANVEEIPAWERKRVRMMTFCLARLLHPSGELALGDGGPIVVSHPGDQLMAVAAVVLEEPAFALERDLPGIWPIAILGKRSRRVYQALVRSPQGGATPRALRRTGFYVLPGDDGDVMILDAAGSSSGRTGSFPFECSVGGRLLVVGPGAGGDDGHPLASWARSPQARNVLVDRRVFTPAPGRGNSEPEVYWTMRDGLLCFAGTDQRAADLRHRRHVFCLPGRFWIVCDEMLGSGTWEGDSLLHLHPDARLRATCAGRRSFVAERSDRASIQIVLATSGEVRVQTGLEGIRPQGWYAPRPGEFVAAPMLSLAVAGTLPLAAGYALLPRSTEPATLVLDSDAFQLRAVLRQGDQEFVVTAADHEVELVRRRPSVESAARDQLGDAGFIVAE